MKTSFLLYLSSLTGSGLSLVPAAKQADTRGLVAEVETTFVPRNTALLDISVNKRAGIQYDNYLPELPEGWPTALEPSKTDSKRTDLAVRSRGDLAIRVDETAFARNLFMGLKIFTVANAAVNWYSLVGSCSQFTAETGNGVQCVFGAISQVIAITTLVYQGAIWRGQLATALTNNGWYVPGITKRDEWASIMGRDLSQALKTEVRHLGTWDGIEQDRKRDAGPAVPREVFGVKVGAQEFHFTYLGRDLQGKDSFKLGLGDGGIPNGSKARRQNQITDGNFYFTSGGIDFASQSVENSASVEWTWGSTTDAVEFSDIFNSVNCYLGGALFGEIDLTLNNAIAYQVYDSFADQTLSAGVMSPFSASQESGIRSLSIGGGIGNNSCAAF